MFTNSDDLLNALTVPMPVSPEGIVSVESHNWYGGLKEDTDPSVCLTYLKFIHANSIRLERDYGAKRVGHLIQSDIDRRYIQYNLYLIGKAGWAICKERCGHIAIIYVLIYPSYRRNGYFNKFISFLEKRKKQIDVHPDIPEDIVFFKKNGFTTYANAGRMMIMGKQNVYKKALCRCDYS